MTQPNLSAISPALGRYEKEALFHGVWVRPGLSQRDRSVITLAALITRGQTGQLAFFANHALDHGVTPKEVSEIVTHLAFYSGWGNATAAAEPIGAVFAERGIGVEQLPLASPELLPLDQAAEGRRPFHSLGKKNRTVTSKSLHLFWRLLSLTGEHGGMQCLYPEM